MFFVNQGYHLRAVIVKETNCLPLNKLAAVTYAEEMKECFEVLKLNLKKAQTANAWFYNKYQKAIEFAIGDQVWLWTVNIHIQRPCQKLCLKKIGPYTIR